MKSDSEKHRTDYIKNMSLEAQRPLRTMIRNGCMIAYILLFIFLCSCSNGEKNPALTVVPENSVIPSEMQTTAPSLSTTPSSEVTPTATQTVKPTVYNFAGQAVCSAKVSANIYEKDSADSAVLGTLPSDEKADVIEYKDKWAHVLYDGKEGYVNMDQLLKLYTPAAPVPEGDWDLILVNSSHYLPDGFKVTVSDFAGGQVDARILTICTQMFEDAKKAGVTLKIVDAYRSYDRQKELYQQKVDSYISKGYSKSRAEKEAATITARPDTSEHQTGLALDIVTPSYTKRDKGFAETKAFKWLDDNAYNYGFTMRYKADKVSITKVIYEPWHWRFVGVTAAISMKISGQCLEEYLGETD